MMTMEKAQGIISAGIVKAKEIGQPMNIAVVDAGASPSPSYSRRPLACVSFGGGMIADARVLSAFHRLTTGTFTNALEG